MLCSCSSHVGPRHAKVKHVTAVYAFVDVIGVWHKQPLTTQQLCWLSAESKPLIAPPFLIRRPARFDPRYVNYTRLLQPSKACLEWLAKRDDIKMTYSELARDHIYEEEDQADATGQLFNMGLVQRRHGNKRTRLFTQGANGNTGTRKPGLTFCWYTTKPSKITGEWPCFHFEARLSGSRMLRRHGIYHPRDLLTFDHAEFWQEMWEKRLTFVTLDRGRFGRWYDNRLNGTRRRTSTQEDFGEVACSTASMVTRAKVASHLREFGTSSGGTLLYNVTFGSCCVLS